MFLKLSSLLAPYGITRYYTDKAGVYQRHLPAAQHTVGKLTMQKIKRKHEVLPSPMISATRRISAFDISVHRGLRPACLAFCVNLLKSSLQADEVLISIL